MLLASSVLFVAGCKKSDDYKAEFDRIGPTQSLLKINYASAYVLNPAVQLNIDDTRVSGLITGRTPFPGGGYNTNGSSFPDYLSLAPGTRKLSVVIPKKGTSVDSIVLFSTQLELIAGVNQSVHIMDTLTKTKALLVTDNISLPTAFKARYRFVNLIPNSDALDLYYGPMKVAAAVPYNTPGAVFEMPAAIPDTFRIREAGSNTVLALYTSGSVISNQRVYTAFAMGYKGSTSATLKPYISFALNY